MRLLRRIFGPSQKEIWQALSAQIGAEYVDGGMWKGDKVQAHVGEWTVTLDLFVVSTGKSHVTYTRVRAPYINADGFRFTIYRKGMFTALGKILGMQDVEVGHEAFDEAFVIKGTDESKLQALFANSKIRALIEAQPQMLLEVREDEGWFSTHFPEGVDELHFQVVGAIKDVARLEQLYNLFGEVLNHLCHIGSAYDRYPNITA